MAVSTVIPAISATSSRLRVSPTWTRSAFFFAESVIEFQEQAGQPLASSLERELIELVHIHSKLITEELDQLDRQLGVPVDDRKIALLLDDADLRGLQRLARHLVKRPLTECLFFDQLTRAQDPDDLPLASRRRTSQLDLARTQQVEAQTQMAFVEDGLLSLVTEGVFDVLKFGEVVSFEVAHHRLPAKRAGVAILDEAGLPFHDLPIIIHPSRHSEILAPIHFGLYRNRLQLSANRRGADLPNDLQTAHTDELAMGNTGAIRATAYIADPRNLTRAMGLEVEFSQAFVVTPQHAQEPILSTTDTVPTAAPPLQEVFPSHPQNGTGES